MSSCYVMPTYNEGVVECGEVFNNSDQERLKKLMSADELPALVEMSFRSNQRVNITAITAINSSFKRRCLPDFDCKHEGNAIVISGYPPSAAFNPDEILAVVRKHAPGAHRE